MAAALQRIVNNDLPIRCRDCSSRSRGFCAGLAPYELARLHPHIVRKRLPAGEAVLAQGAANASYVHVLDGTVKLTTALPDGTEQIVGLRFSGDFLGQRFASEVNFTAQAATDLEYCRVSKSAMDTLADTNTTVSHLMHQWVADELQETRNLMLTLTQRDARQRVAGLVYRLGHRQMSPAGHARFELALSRTDMGNYLGLTVETISRQLSALKRDGLMSIERKSLITVFDMRKLANAAGISQRHDPS
jgi:CRP/FNR family transcriptional regulator